MSYCVNCGVELDASAKKCALCNTPVINPNIHTLPKEEKPFPEEVHLPEGVKKRFLALIATVAIFVPDIVMFFLNVFFIRKGFWSMYVLSASLLFWVLFVVPLFTKKINAYVTLLFDTAAVSLFTYVMFGLLMKNMLVTKSVLSVIAVIAAAILVLLIWLRLRKRHWTAITVVAFFEAAVVSLISGLLVAFFSGIYNFFIVGVVICVCALVMMLFFIYCNRSKHVRAWLNKFFYI